MSEQPVCEHSYDLRSSTDAEFLRCLKCRKWIRQKETLSNKKEVTNETTYDN
jgi:hypothetical protein